MDESTGEEVSRLLEAGALRRPVSARVGRRQLDGGTPAIERDGGPGAACCTSVLETQPMTAPEMSPVLAETRYLERAP